MRPFEINPDGTMLRGTHTIAHRFNTDSLSGSDPSQVYIGVFVKVFGGQAGTTAVHIYDPYMTSEMYGR